MTNWRRRDGRCISLLKVSFLLRFLWILFSCLSFFLLLPSPSSFSFSWLPRILMVIEQWLIQTENVYLVHISLRVPHLWSNIQDSFCFSWFCLYFCLVWLRSSFHCCCKLLSDQKFPHESTEITMFYPKKRLSGVTTCKTVSEETEGFPVFFPFPEDVNQSVVKDLFPL